MTAIYNRNSLESVDHVGVVVLYRRQMFVNGYRRYSPTEWREQAHTVIAHPLRTWHYSSMDHHHPGAVVCEVLPVTDHDGAVAVRVIWAAKDALYGAGDYLLVWDGSRAMIGPLADDVDVMVTPIREPFHGYAGTPVVNTTTLGGGYTACVPVGGAEPA